MQQVLVFNFFGLNSHFFCHPSLARVRYESVLAEQEQKYNAIQKTLKDRRQDLAGAEQAKERTADRLAQAEHAHDEVHVVVSASN